MKTTWDYTDLARFYDKRADYAPGAIDELLSLAQPSRERPVADIGAGTGKLTVPLLARGYRVLAVEPNDEMRALGIRNTEGRPATWSEGTGEATGLPDACTDLVTFGSSFNVTDRPKALIESARLLRSHGWFACMWNHRDLEDPVQAAVEAIIKAHIEGYDYGTRREDQSEIIQASGLFEEPVVLSGRTEHTLPTGDYVEGWRSHATLQRQAADRFDAIIKAIEQELAGRETLTIPFTTRIWCARRLK